MGGGGGSARWPRGAAPCARAAPRAVGGAGVGRRSRSPGRRVLPSGSPLPSREGASGLQEGARRGKRLLGRRGPAGNDLTRPCRKRVTGPVAGNASPAAYPWSAVQGGRPEPAEGEEDEGHSRIQEGRTETSRAAPEARGTLRGQVWKWVSGHRSGVHAFREELSVEPLPGVQRFAGRAFCGFTAGR